ncbi:MAG: SCO family protein [Bacteroides sp.]|nr:MAG: SCO family protein [Bacteroides sp.]
MIKYNQIIYKSLIITTVLLILGCTSKKTLPFFEKNQTLSIHDFSYKKEYHTISSFKLINQNNEIITNEFYNDKLYVADFFFTNCPTICPGIKKNMLKIQNKYLKDNRVHLLSHTIDYKNDTALILKKYMKKIGANENKWNFVYGAKNDIYEIARESYMAYIKEDSKEPGGFLHSGVLLLIDKNRYIRGVYDGSSNKDINILIKDIKILLKEY